MSSRKGVVPSRANRALVRKAERVSDAANQTVRVADLCLALNVSRRALHRAFAAAVGAGPIAHLRRRRLIAIREALADADADAFTIAHIAAQHGLTQPGRFASYYRALFGEVPSDTRSSRKKPRQR